MTASIVEPSRVILPAATWRAELAGELQRLGLSAEQADEGAVKALQRILGRAGWPREVFRVAGPALTDEETAELMAAAELAGEAPSHHPPSSPPKEEPING